MKEAAQKPKVRFNIKGSSLLNVSFQVFVYLEDESVKTTTAVQIRIKTASRLVYTL